MTSAHATDDDAAHLTAAPAVLKCALHTPRSLPAARAASIGVTGWAKLQATGSATQAQSGAALGV